MFALRLVVRCPGFRDRSTHQSGPIASKGGDEILCGNTRLSKDTRESANLDLAMIGNHASSRAMTHHDVAAFLPYDLEAQTL